MRTLYAVLALCFFACNPNSNGSSSVESNTSQQTQLPKVEVKLPPPPSFNKEHPPETYPDSSYSVYGLRKNSSKFINSPTQVRVKAFLLEVYECPPCPKGQKCEQCFRRHFFISDRANGPKSKALMVTDYPKRDPKTRKNLEFQVGAQYYVTGNFAERSLTGFSNSDGLLIYSDASKVPAAE